MDPKLYTQLVIGITGLVCKVILLNHHRNCEIYLSKLFCRFNLEKCGKCRGAHYIFSKTHPTLERNILTDLCIDSLSICIKTWEHNIFYIFRQNFQGIPFEIWKVRGRHIVAYIEGYIFAKSCSKIRFGYGTS